MVETNQAVDILHATGCANTSNEVSVQYLGRDSGAAVPPSATLAGAWPQRWTSLATSWPLNVETEFQNVGLCKNVLAQCSPSRDINALPATTTKSQTYSVVQYIPPTTDRCSPPHSSALGF